jgi:hypothetical protein
LPESIKGWKGSVGDFVDFITSGTTATRESGNCAANNYFKGKILKAVYADRSTDRSCLEQVVEFVDDVDGWWKEGNYKVKQEEGADAEEIEEAATIEETAY